MGGAFEVLFVERVMVVKVWVWGGRDVCMG